MYQPDYDSAASHWIERDRDSIHMEAAALKEMFEIFSQHKIVQKKHISNRIISIAREKHLGIIIS